MNSTTIQPLTPLQAKAERLVAVVESIKPAVEFFDAIAEEETLFRKGREHELRVLGRIRDQCLAFLGECVVACFHAHLLKHSGFATPPRSRDDLTDDIARQLLLKFWPESVKGTDPSVDTEGLVELIERAARASLVFDFNVKTLNKPAESAAPAD